MKYIIRFKFRILVIRICFVFRALYFRKIEWANDLLIQWDIPLNDVTVGGNENNW